MSRSAVAAVRIDTVPSGSGFHILDMEHSLATRVALREIDTAVISRQFGKVMSDVDARD